MPEAIHEPVLRVAAPDRARLLAALSAAAPDEPPGYRGPGPRLALIDPTPARLDTARKLVTRGAPVRKRGDLWFSPAPVLAGGGRTAFLFPGLEADFTPRIDDIAELLGVPAPPVSTATLGGHGSAVLAVSRLLDTGLRRMNLRPDAVAGHSVGEWAAMICGGIFSGADFDGMVARADLDSLPVPEVEFAVLGCPADRLRAELGDGTGIVVSHENSAHQTVVCGPEEDVAALVTRLRASGIIGNPLPFRSGFHTPMFEPYAGPFRAGVPSLPMRAAHTPVWSATTAAPFPEDPQAIRELFLRHLVDPVRFRALVRALHESGVRAFVVVGPGQLGSLVEDTLGTDVPGADFAVMQANSPRRSGIGQLRRCALALWTEGAEPDLDGLEPAPAIAARADAWSGFSRLALLAKGSRPAAEMAAFLDETADAVGAVLRAVTAGEDKLVVSLHDMPHLLDHCLMRQRPGWPVDEDLRPLVPATTMITHMFEAAERAASGTFAVAAEDIGFHRWLPAAPARTVPVHVERRSPGRLHVRLGDYAESTVVLAERHPAPPPAWPPGEDERPPALTAREMYRQRWMFHGPAFQGMTRTESISDNELRGVVTVPEAPGGLLDNVGQFLGQWLVENEPGRWFALPARIDRVVLHGPEPAPGTEVDCVLRVTASGESSVTMDAQLLRAGVPVVSVTGWTDRRFDGGDVFRDPGTTLLAEPTGKGTWLLAEPWTTLVSRELHLQRYAGQAECLEYAGLPPARRRGWLTRLIVAKDAVRAWAWRDGGLADEPIYPAELRVHQDPGGGVRVTGEHGLVLAGLEVTVVQHGVVAEASVSGASAVITRSA